MGRAWLGSSLILTALSGARESTSKMASSLEYLLPQCFTAHPLPRCGSSSRASQLGLDFSQHRRLRVSPFTWNLAFKSKYSQKGGKQAVLLQVGLGLT